MLPFNKQNTVTVCIISVDPQTQIFDHVDGANLGSRLVGAWTIAFWNRVN